MLINQLDSDMYLLTGDAYQSNSTALIRRDEAVLIDGMASRSDAEQIKEWLEYGLRKQVRFILCTHYFCDHLAALNVFPRAEILAHHNYRETFDAELFCSADEKRHFREPDILISDDLKIRWGSRTLKIFHNPGHTLSTMNVDIEESDLVIASDNLVGNLVYLAYSNLERAGAALEKLSATGRTRIVAGHGKVRGRDAIDNAQYYLSRLRRWATASEIDSTPRGASLEYFLPAGIAATPFETLYHDRNVRLFADPGALAAGRFADINGRSGMSV